MALRKTITDPQGNTTTYHRVGHISFIPTRYRPCRVTFELLSFATADFKVPNRPLSGFRYTFDVSSDEESSMGIRTLCYTKLKELEEWADAEDC